MAAPKVDSNTKKQETPEIIDLENIFQSSMVNEAPHETIYFKNIKFILIVLLAIIAVFAYSYFSKDFVLDKSLKNKENLDDNQAALLYVPKQKITKISVKGTVLKSLDKVDYKYQLVVDENLKYYLLSNNIDLDLVVNQEVEIDGEKVDIESENGQDLIRVDSLKLK